MTETYEIQDAFSVIKESRVIVINDAITDVICSKVCLWLLKLEAMDAEKDITIMLNSPGGCIQAGFMLIDTMTVLKCPVEVICTGLAASMGALILMAGTKGKRKMLPHARVMIHQPLGGASLMQASDFEISARELTRVKKEVYGFICSSTGKTYKQVQEDCDRNFWMDANEALTYGIIDSIVTREAR